MWCMTKRLSLSLENEDEAMLAHFAVEDSPERRVLISWAALRGMSPDEIRSEAALLRVLLRVGAERLQEQVLDAGYAQLASELDTTAEAEIDEARRRYVHRSGAMSSE
jgi:hypothetical protein